MFAVGMLLIFNGISEIWL